MRKKTQPGIEQKEMMHQPIEKKSQGQVNKIQQDNTWLIEIKTDKPRQYGRHHRNRKSEDPSGFDIVLPYHRAKIMVFSYASYNFRVKREKVLSKRTNA
jgi:hypothetical protein